MPDSVLGVQLNTLFNTSHEIESQVKGFAQGLINDKVGNLTQVFWLQVPYFSSILIFII